MARVSLLDDLTRRGQISNNLAQLLDDLVRQLNQGNRIIATSDGLYSVVSLSDTPEIGFSRVGLLESLAGMVWASGIALLQTGERLHFTLEEVQSAIEAGAHRLENANLQTRIDPRIHISTIRYEPGLNQRSDDVSEEETPPATDANKQLPKAP